MIECVGWGVVDFWCGGSDIVLVVEFCGGRFFCFRQKWYGVWFLCVWCGFVWDDHDIMIVDVLKRSFRCIEFEIYIVDRFAFWIG